MKNIKFLKTDLHETTKFIKEFMIFQKIILKPLIVGFFLTGLLTATRPFHASFCSSLNSMFSPNLLIFTSYTALILHAISPWCKISKISAESIYEVSSQVTFFLISGIAAALLVLNYQENAITWGELLKFTIVIVPFFYFFFSSITTFPLFLLTHKPAIGTGFKQKFFHPSMLYVYLFIISLTAFYIFEPMAFPEHNFCETTSTES